MSKAVVSARVFAVYLFITGLLLVFIPNVMLPLFQLPPATDVWVRVVGVVAVMLGVYAWGGDRYFLVASVYTRTVVFIAFCGFVLAGLATPMFALFGVIDLLGAAWTFAALRADARSA